jgi:hypothetical protein
MRAGLVGVIVVGSGIAAAVSELFLLRIVQPPYDASALLGGLWVAMPYLASVALALLMRRHYTPQLVLLVAFLVATAAGLSFLGNAAAQRELSRYESVTAVFPGEDPTRGPAAMRKTSAEVNEAFTGVFSVLLLALVPPVQLALVLVPTLIARGVVALARPQAGASDHRSPASARSDGS